MVSFLGIYWQPGSGLNIDLHPAVLLATFSHRVVRSQLALSATNGSHAFGSDPRLVNQGFADIVRAPLREALILRCWPR